MMARKTDKIEAAKNRIRMTLENIGPIETLRIIEYELIRSADAWHSSYGDALFPYREQLKDCAELVAIARRLFDRLAWPDEIASRLQPPLRGFWGNYKP